tara:strand:- start:125 stop:1378 length:1254 start_codon:yes stop_codon:yes gene_type:complete
MLFKKKNNCRLCNSNELNEILNLGYSPIGDNYTKKKNNSKLIPLKLYGCKKCKFKQTSHVVNEDKVYGDYLYTTSTSAGLKKHFEKSFYFLRNFHPNLKKNDLVLDIGSNDGSNLEIFKSNNLSVIGVEPAKSLAKLSNKKKIFTFNNFFNKKISNIIKKKYGIPKIICIYNLLANIDDLNLFLKNLSALVDNNTIVSIESFSLLGIIKDNLFDHIYHEHLSYFQVQTLKVFFEKHGLNILYAEYNQIKGSSIKILIGKNKKLINKRSISSCIKLENSVGVNKILSFKKIKKNNLKFVNRLEKELDRLKIKKIAGFGASCGSTTFIFHLGLSKLLAYFIDDEPKRNKLYSPNANIQVFNFNTKIISKLDAVLVISWRYEKIIYKKFIKEIKKNKFVKSKKIYWIIPYPKFKIKEIKI